MCNYDITSQNVAIFIQVAVTRTYHIYSGVASEKRLASHQMY